MASVGPFMAERDDRDVELAETFAEVARALLDESGVDATLDRICSLAVETVAGCQAAGISIAEGKRITSRARTHELPRVLDQLAVRYHDQARYGYLGRSCAPSRNERQPARL